MSNPQQPEIARSRKTHSQDPDSVAAVIQGSPIPADEGPRGPVPPDNQPGHHPATEQDKPDLNAFAERLGTSGTTSSGPVVDPGDEPAPRRALARRPVRQVAAALLVVVAVLMLGRVARRRLGAA